MGSFEQLVADWKTAVGGSTPAIPATAATPATADLGLDKTIPATLATPATTIGRTTPLPKGSHCSRNSRGTVPPTEQLAKLDVTLCYIQNKTHATQVVKKLAKEKLLGIDLETTGLNPQTSNIRLVQIYTGGNDVFVFDVFTDGMLDVLSPLWGITMVAHNAVFEIKFLLKAGISLKRIGCTMLQYNAYKNSLPSLKDLAQKYFNLTLDKKYQRSDWSQETLTPDQLAYAALDAVICFQLAPKLAAKIRKLNRVEIYQRMVKVQKCIAQLELNGVYFEQSLHSTWLESVLEKKEKAEVALRSYFGDDINLNSPVQLSAWLENNLPKDLLPTWPRTAKGQFATGVGVFKQYPNLAYSSAVLEYRFWAKRDSTYGAKYVSKHVNKLTNRIHASFRIAGTRTGRFSCNTPNLQQVPRDAEFRACLCTQSDRVFVVADYSQIELRVAALLANDTAMLLAYENGEDLHAKTAAAFLNISQDKVTKEQRNQAKAINFGMLFGMQPKGLVDYAFSNYGVKLTIEEATQAQNAFFITYPNIKRWQQKTIRVGRLRNAVSTKGGRVRDFNNEDKGFRSTEAINTPVQGTAADILLEALIGLDSHLTGLDALLVCHVHDEIVLDVAKQDADKAKHALELAMIEGFLNIFPDAKDITKNLVDAHSGHSWQEAK